MHALDRLAAAIAVSFALAGSVDAQAAQAAARPTDNDLRKLGASLTAYFEARDNEVGVERARAAASQGLYDLRAKFAGWDPLRTSGDLGRALELAGQARRAEGRDEKVTVETIREGSFSNAGLEFAVRLPKGYDSARNYPLILSIPDHDEKPADHIRTHWTTTALRDAAIVVSPAMPTERADWTRVAVNGRPGGLCHALTVLRVASERFAIDVDRVYVVGHGRSVPAAVACGNYSPQRFAGIAGRSGDAGELTPANFTNLPTYFASGGAQAAAFQAAAEKLGIDHCELKSGGTEEDVWNWMQAHPRRRAPTRVTVVPGDPFPTRAYWLRVAPSAPDASATAAIERASNTVRITAHGVSGVTLLLNDALLDLDQPLRIVCNDIESTAAVVRDLSLALDTLHDGLSDTNTVYVARTDVDLTGNNAVKLPEPTAAEEAEFQTKLAGAEHDSAKLWELYLFYKSNQHEVLAARVLRKLVRVAPDYEPARTALGYVRSGDRWFRSRDAMERFERSQDAAVAQARGLTRQRSMWVHNDERALVGKGLTKDYESGLWLSPEEHDQLVKGCARQDFDWIAPNEADRVDAGLWRVEGEWLDLEHANQRHSAIDAMWHIPTSEIVLYTTTDRDTGLRAIEHMGRALDDLRRVFGAEPQLPLAVAMMRDEEQFDRFAFGDPDGRRRAAHAGRLQTIDYGFVAESWFPPSEGRRTFRGVGVGYWDAFIPNGNSYGVHSARLACGLSYVEAIDPSPKAVQSASNGGPKPGYYEAYQAEKRLPAWLHYGGAVYAERFFRDTTVGPDGDAWWARKWSLDNLHGLGELDSLNDVFAFRLDPDNRNQSRKLLLEAGLVVAFLVDGGCEPAGAALLEFQRALVAGRMSPKVIAALTAAVAEHEPELKRFAGP
jgi:hypothetical protein